MEMTTTTTTTTDEEENVNNNSSQPNPFSYSSNNQQGTTIQPIAQILSGYRSGVSFKTKTTEQLPGYLQEYGFHVGQEVHVMENMNRGGLSVVIDARIRWMGTINSQLYFGLDSDRPQLKKLVHFQPYVRQIGRTLERLYDWLIKPQCVRPLDRPFIRQDLPPFEQYQFQTGRMVKVVGSEEIGTIKWTGQINGEWFIGLEIMNRNNNVHVSCQILEKYPELNNLFVCTNDRPMMLVTSRQVQVYQEEMNMYPLVIMVDQRNLLNVSNAMEQSRESGDTSENVPSTSFAASTSRLFAASTSESFAAPTNQSFAASTSESSAASTSRSLAASTIKSFSASSIESFAASTSRLLAASTSESFVAPISESYVASTNQSLAASTSGSSTASNSETSRGNPPEQQGTECIICLSELAVYLVVPCGHMCLCSNCHNQYSRNNNLKRNCPLCRGRVKTFIQARM